MRAGQGTPQNKHLETIEPDQSIQGIEQIDDTIRNDAGRKFFISQAIQPVIEQARYNAVTGRYELGPEDRNAHTIVTSTTSAATTDFVITAGETWEIIFVSCSNQTAASTSITSYYDGANTFALYSLAGSGATAAYGGTYAGNPVRITGDGTVAIRCVLATFAAGNTVRAMLVYRRVA